MKTPALIVALAAIFSPAASFSQSDGPFFPNQSENQPLSSCPACAGAIWNNTSKISAADNIFSDAQLMPNLYCFQSQCYRSRYLTCHHFGFNISGNATITGIVLSVKGKASIPASVMDSTVVLMKNYQPGSANYASGSDWDTTNTVRIYGGPNDLWGTTWTPQEVNNNLFGAYVKVYNTSVNSPSAFVDAVTLTVFYSLGTQTYSQTSLVNDFHAFYDPVDKNVTVDIFNEEENGVACLQCMSMEGKLIFTRNLT
ncbi:MAG TPA: hypothetical protein VI112_18310, partial [Bacteroidia bacterium]